MKLKKVPKRPKRFRQIRKCISELKCSDRGVIHEDKSLRGAFVSPVVSRGL